MNGYPEGLRNLTKYSKLPVDRISYFPNADEKIVRMIGRGVLFQMAFWSISAAKAFPQSPPKYFPFPSLTRRA